MLICNNCLRQFETAELFIKHMRILHKFVEYYVCGFRLCDRSLNSIQALKHHIFICHSKSPKKIEKYMDNDENVGTLNNIISTLNNDYKLNNNNSEILSENEETEKSVEVDYVISYLCKFYNNPTMSRKCIQDVVTYTHGLVTDIFSKIETSVEYHVNRLPSDFLSEITSLLINPFNNILTEYKRFNYLQNSSNYIKAVKIEIDKILEDKRKNGSISLDYRWCYLHAVPLKEVLKKFLQIDNVFSKISDYISSESTNEADVMSSIFNANLWKEIKLKFKETVIPIILYYDDFECGNPLGTQAGVHKLGGVYFTLAGIPPEFGARLENIFLAGLFYSSDRTLFGNSAIFNNFFEQLSLLETNGIILEIGTELHKIFFVLFIIAGDNLAVNGIGGFSESFSSTYYCRFCFSTKQECQSMCQENISTLRNIDNYDQHIQGFTCGIKENCIFNNLKNFHCVVNSSCDVMHDLLEGVCRYDMALLLYNFIFVKKYFSLDILNKRIKYFDYDYCVDAGNRIPQILTAHINNKCLIMSAAEMLAFVTYFPLLVSDFVDLENSLWSFFLLLYDILHLSLKSEISLSEISYLQHLINQHNSEYLRIFQIPLKPKHHILVHYPNVIKKVGPLRYLSAMRFESFHKIGKTNAHIVKSRINLPHTLSIRYQLQLCYRLQSKIGLNNKLELGKTWKFSFNDFENLPDVKNTPENLFRVNWLKFNGIHFKLGCAILLEFDELPIFGVIERIVCSTKNDVFFYCKIIDNVEIRGNIRAIALDFQSKCFKWVCLNDLYRVQTFKIHNIVQQLQVVSVYHL